MKLLLKAILISGAFAAFCLPAATQENAAGPEEGIAQAAAETVPPRTAPKKTAAKHKKNRKKKPDQVSEYKFKSAEQTPTYKFDKKADPIFKPAKKKKKPKTPAGGSAASGPKPKLKKVKSLGAPDTADPAAAPGLAPDAKLPEGE